MSHFSLSQIWFFLSKTFHFYLHILIFHFIFTFIFSSSSEFFSRTAFMANSVFSNSTRAQTLAAISGCLLTNGRTSAGIGFPGLRILTRTMSPQALKISATPSMVGLSRGKLRTTTVLEGVVSSYSGRASNLRTLVFRSLTSSLSDFFSTAYATCSTINWNKK